MDTNRLKKMDRISKWNIILIERRKTRLEVAEALNIKKDSLNKKIYGISLFNEKQINTILKFLNIKYEDLFL